MKSSTTDLYEIGPYIARAKSLIDEDTQVSLRYAALELRFTFEHIAYRQLQQYGTIIPSGIVGTWKPDQIVRLLASFDPTSISEGELSFAIPSKDGSPAADWMVLGQTKGIPWRRFRSYYQKLGSFLHAPAPPQAGHERRPLSKDLFQDIVTALESVMTASLILAIQNVVSAQCECGTIIHIGEPEFSDGETISCPNTKCNLPSIKHITNDGAKTLQKLKLISMKCQKCEARIPIYPEKIWAPIKCIHCSVTYRLNLSFTGAYQVEE
jgi:hypothetical protein